MKVSVPGADEASRAEIASWGYQIVESEDGVPAIGIGAENAIDDFINAPIDRAEFDARVQRIYGGANEIMKELIGRDLGL